MPIGCPPGWLAMVTAPVEQVPPPQVVQQRLPQAPQLPASLSRSTSQPSAGSPSQSEKPGSQVKPQAAPSQVAVACAGAGQAVPVGPQLAGSRSLAQAPPAGW